MPNNASIETINGYPVFDVKDANGTRALPVTNYVWNVSGLLVPAPVDANGIPQMSLAGSNAIYNGTYTVTGTGAAIASSQACSAVLIQNDPNSGGPIYVGGSSGQTISLAPGAAKEYQVSNVDMIYAKFGSGTTSATLNWEARS